MVVLLAWLLPGAGHWYIGQRGKALVFCFGLVLLFATGVLLTNGYCVDLDLHFYSFLLQVFEGALALAALAAPPLGPQLPASRLSDLGMLLTLVAGALNVLLIADALYRSGAAPGEQDRPRGGKKRD